MDNLKLEQTISKLNLDNLEIVLKMIWKQIIKLNGKPEEIVKITFNLVEKEKWPNFSHHTTHIYWILSNFGRLIKLFSLNFIKK